MRIFLISILTFTFLNADVLLREEFDSLKNWEALTFKKIEKHSTYETSNSTLVAKSDASASGIKLKKHYDIYKYPTLSFKWKINNVYEKGDATTKEGDDYPIRIYIMFEYNADKAGFLESVKYELAKSFYGEYPPHSALNYIWANKKQKDRVITSAYADKSQMIVLDSGEQNANVWREHTVDILKDYKEAFGKNPPRKVTLAIMSDSDNTKEASLSYVDFIEIKN